MKVNIFALSMLFLSIFCFAMESNSDDPDLEKGESELAMLERQIKPQKSIIGLLRKEHKAVFPDKFSEADIEKVFEKYFKNHDNAQYNGLVSQLEAKRTRGSGQTIDPKLTSALLQAFSVGLSAMADSKRDKKNEAKEKLGTERKNRGTERKAHVTAETALGVISTGLGLAWFLWSRGCQ